MNNKEIKNKINKNNYELIKINVILKILYYFISFQLGIIFILLVQKYT